MNNTDLDIPVYIQAGDSAVYALPLESGYGWCGYILPEGTSPPAATLTPEQAFNDQNGHFLFAPEEPPAMADPEAFAIDFYDFLGSNFVGRAILWMPQAVLPPSDDFNSYGVRFFLSGIVPTWQVGNNLNIFMGSSLTFFINYGCYVSYDEGLNAIKFNTGSVTTTTIGYKGVNSGIDILNNNGRVASLLLTGDHAGSLLFTSTYNPVQALNYFKTGFEYNVNSRGIQESLLYPVFDASKFANAPFDLTTTLDPLDKVNAGMNAEDLAAGFFRTGYAFPQGLNLGSWFRTTNHHEITLRPLGGASGDGHPVLFAGGMVFYETSQKNVVIYGMTLVGDYALTVPGYENPRTLQQMLCGLFGTEWLSFMPYDHDQPDDQNDCLRFLPCQGAYAPVFPFETAELINPTSGAVTPRLTQSPGKKNQTSWANMVPGASQTQYSAQPEGSSLYGDPATGNEITLLSSKPPASDLPKTPGFAFPLVPYAGLTGELKGDEFTSFESEILSATRKSQINEVTSPTRHQLREANQSKLAKRIAANTDPAQRITTPQGLLVDLADDGITYEKVLLGRSQKKVDEFLDFALENPTVKMLDALQTNQLFLVGVNNTPFAGDGASFANRVVIDDWPFIAEIGEGATATDYRNVMIMKFCTGSLKDRVTNPNRWTMPDDFSLLEGGDAISSLAFTGLSQWLQDYIALAEKKAEVEGPNGLYSNFANLVKDPNWNGIIVFNANLPLEALPSQISGIAAGIDHSLFMAHHFGASVSRVKHENGSLDVQGISNLFGLIDYENPAYRAATTNGAPQGTSVYLPTVDGYAFSVLQLQVLFMQSRMVTFNSYIQLSMEKLFGSEITSTQFSGQASPINAMVLKGTALQQNGVTTYAYEQAGGYLFGLDSNALQMISVNRVQFNTLGASDGGDTMNSRFLMWGRLNFTLLEMTGDTPGPFDLLSFGSEQGQTPGNQGLAYANLIIDMSFPTVTPNATSFLFDTGHLGFDLAGSTPRNESLFKGFALQIKKFIAASKDQQPKDFNFLTVQPQGLSLKQLTGEWYGVSYKVTMGTPGALVSGAGFESDLLVAWSPSSKAKDQNAAVFVGLSLPGAAPGASLFSLQGVFKVSTGPLKLLYQDVPGGRGKFFNLQLTDIGVKILGIAKLPPGATIQFFLFGDPESSGSLGWYAAYNKDDPSKSAPPKLQSITTGKTLPPAKSQSAG